MRIRTIKPEFFKHDGLAELAALTRLLFIGLWSLADREGRLEDRPARIKVEVLPYDDADVNKMLAELDRAGFLTRYQTADTKLIEIKSFKRHQRITGKEAETESRFPAPSPTNTRGTAGKQPGNTREAPETTGNGRETEGNEERNGLAAVSRPRARDTLLDSLMLHAEQTDPLKASKSLWPKCAASLSIIRAASPEVTPAMIERAAANYHSHFTDAAISSTALAKHWGRCAEAKQNSHVNRHQTPALTDEDHAKGFFDGIDADQPKTA